MRVREALPRDAEGLIGLLEAVLGRRLDEEERAQLTRNLLYFLSEKGNALLVLEEGEEILGAASVWVRQGVFDDLPTARVDRLLLAPGQGERAALMLLEQAAALARSVGAGDFEVVADETPLEPSLLTQLGMHALGAYRARIR